MDNYTEIVEALETIQKVCHVYDCHDCPLGNDNGHCKIKEFTPIDWDITKPRNIVRLLG